jgi:hypothetical protein
MDLKRRGMVALLVTGSMAGGALGATVLSAGSSTAATTTTTTASSTPPGAPGTAPSGGKLAPNGKFVPNENPTHEKSESPQREAQENAGQVPTVP